MVVLRAGEISVSFLATGLIMTDAITILHAPMDLGTFLISVSLFSPNEHKKTKQFPVKGIILCRSDAY